MVVCASVLVVGNHEKRFLPSWRLADGLPDIEEKLFASDNIMRGMLIIWVDEEAGLQEGVLPEVAASAVSFEVVEVVEVVTVGPETGKHEPGQRRDDAGIAIHTPVGVEFFEHVENGPDVPVEGVGGVSVVDISVRGAGMYERTVWPGLAGHRAKVTVRDSEVGGKSRDDRQLGGTKRLHDLDILGRVCLACDVRVVDYKAQVRPSGMDTGRLRSEELISDVGEGLFRIRVGIGCGRRLIADPNRAGRLAREILRVGRIEERRLEAVVFSCAGRRQELTGLR